MQHLWVWLCEKNVNIQLFRTRLVRAISGQGRETDCTGGLSHFICYLCVAFQAKSVHVEIGVLPVRSVKTGLHHPFHCAMDKWQLWSSWCKCDFILTFAFFFFFTKSELWIIPFLLFAGGYERWSHMDKLISRNSHYYRTVACFYHFHSFERVLTCP